MERFNIFMCAITIFLSGALMGAAISDYQDHRFKNITTTSIDNVIPPIDASALDCIDCKKVKK